MARVRQTAAGDLVIEDRRYFVKRDDQWKILQAANLANELTFNLDALTASRAITMPDQAIDLTPNTGSFISSGELIEKGSDETVTSSTTPQQDDAFQFTLAANTTYFLWGQLNSTPASATPGLKTRWDWPVGTTGRIVTHGGSSGNFKIFKQSASGASYGQTLPGQLCMFTVSGYIVTGGTPGTLDFLWAQNSSSVDASQIDGESAMILIPVA